MPKTDTTIGLLAAERVDRKIHLCKEFVIHWRSSCASEKIQFIEFLSRRSVCPENLLSIHQRLVLCAGLAGDNAYDILGYLQLLGTSSSEYRELREDRASIFREVSQRRAI